jgi:CheY-like chemotaxis protein
MVDDNIDCLYLVQVIFEDYQAQVKTVTSVDEAIEAIEESKPDVLISDICMQGKDGYSLIRSIRLKEVLEGGFLPALALTGYAHPQARTKALEAGFQELILKPFDADQLVAEVAKLTRLRYSSTNKQTFLPGEGKRGKEKREKEKIILNTHKSFSYMTPNKGLKPPRSCVAFNWGGVTIRNPIS